MNLLIQIIIYILLILSIVILSYDQGYYDGLKQFCEKGVLVKSEVNNKYECFYNNYDKGGLIFDNY